MSLVIRLGIPVATMTKSAILVHIGKCSGGVYRWQIVTVASPVQLYYQDIKIPKHNTHYKIACLCNSHCHTYTSCWNHL